MNIVVPSLSTEHISIRTARPSFLGILRGEFFKISRQWTTWIMAVMLLGAIALPYIVYLTVPDAKNTLHSDPLNFIDVRAQSGLAILRAFGGIFLIILTARVIGLEYQLGTIRILLARGVGRLQLLLVKLLAIVLIALLILVVGLLLNVALMYSLVFILAGNTNAFNALTSTFWSDMQLYVLTILISMGATILLVTAVTVVGRSLTFGLSVGLGWFAADNIGTIFMLLANRLTHSDFWLNATGYFLGPVLNNLPTTLISGKVLSIGSTPLVKVNSTQSLLVILAYSLIFAITTIILTWRRDVKE